MKKSLFITHMLERNGAPIVLVQMMDVFEQNGYSVDVISMYDGPMREDLEARGISVDIIEDPSKNTEEIKARLKGYDIVICNTLITVSFVVLMNDENIPVLWWIHEGRSYFEMYKNILSKVSVLSSNIRILSVSPSVHAFVKEYCGIDSDIVPFAVPEKNAAPDSNHMWQDDKLKLIMTGPLSFMKGQDIFIDALNLLPESMVEKIQVIMCAGTNQKNEEVVEKVKAASQKYHNITVLDSVPHDEMLSLISHADFLLANSRQEPMPTVAAEAWMCGTPAILSDACGIGYYASDDMKKLIYISCDSMALSDLLQKCFEIRKSDTYDKLVKKGREVYRANFTSGIFEENVLKEIAIVSAATSNMAASKGKLHSMKKSLFITHMLDWSGAPIVLLQMMDVFSHNGYSVDVISMADGELRDDLESRGISVEIIDDPTHHQEELKARLTGYDIVICNTLMMIFFVMLMHEQNIPVIWWIHEPDYCFEAYKKFLSAASTFSSNIRILSVSPHVRDLVKEYCGVDSDIVPFAVSEVETVPDSDHLWQNDKLRLIMVGPISYQKGQDIFTAALGLLSEQAVQQMQIIMCAGTDHYEEETLCQVKAASEKYHNITVIDSITHDQMLSLIASADFLLVNSRQEAMSAVAAEAWMCGTPAILSDVCGICYYAKDDMRNLIYKTCDSQALADLLKKSFQIRDSDEYDKLVREGHEAYRSTFTSGIFEQNVLKEIALVTNAASHMSGLGAADYADEHDTMGHAAEPNGKLICMVGVYDIPDIFMYEMIKEFKALGYEIYLFDTSKMQESLSHLEPFLKSHVNAVLTFNNLGFNMELMPGKNLWEQLGIPIINILMDHPFCHQKALDAAPSNAIVLCPDVNHMKYLQRFYPQIETVGFLGHGGKYIESAKKPIAERKIDVLYAGNLSRAFIDQYKPDFSKYNFDAKGIAEAAYNELIEDFNTTTESALEHQLNLGGIELSDNELKEFIADMRYVDMLAVSFYGEKTVRTLALAGFNITLYGSGWEICDWVNDLSNVDYRGRVSAYDIVDIMQDTKIVLSTMTWFKDGTHDRVYNGMLAGALVVTDASDYMLSKYNGRQDLEKPEIFDTQNTDDINQELVIFKLDELDSLPGRIRKIIDYPQIMQQIADNGLKRAISTDTWQCRADELDRDLLSLL